MTPALAPYAVLLRSFVDGRLSADEFETVFLPLYKNDGTAWPGPEFRILDTLFGDVDEYCGDDELRADVGGLDAGELAARAGRALRALEDLTSTE